MTTEIIKKTYQFSEGDTYCIAEVDCFKKTITIKEPIIWRIVPFHGNDYWNWVYLKRLAIQHLKKVYGFSIINH